MIENNGIYQNNEWTTHENKEAGPVQPVQMNIYQLFLHNRLKLATFLQLPQSSRGPVKVGPTVLNTHFSNLFSISK